MAIQSGSRHEAVFLLSELPSIGRIISNFWEVREVWYDLLIIIIAIISTTKFTADKTFLEKQKFLYDVLYKVQDEYLLENRKDVNFFVEGQQYYNVSSIKWA